MSLDKPTPAQISGLVGLALAEDFAHQDSTSLAVVPETAQCQAQMVARADGVVAGVDFAVEAFKQCDSKVTVQVLIHDGERVGADDVIMFACGPARGILGAERVALNFLQQLSGVATATSLAVAAANGVTVLDTRKLFRACARYKNMQCVLVAAKINAATYPTSCYLKKTILPCLV